MLTNPQVSTTFAFFANFLHFLEYLPGNSNIVNASMDTCIVRLYGANEKGNSIAVHVYNFRPYFYIQVPVTMAI